MSMLDGAMVQCLSPNSLDALALSYASVLEFMYSNKARCVYLVTFICIAQHCRV
jgi:hypothetical protein